VNNAMAAQGSADGAAARRTVVRQCLPSPHQTLVASASAAAHAQAMAARLAPVRAALRGAGAGVGWREVASVLLAGARRPQVIAFASIGCLVLLRTLLQDRIARLNGRIVDHVLQQDKAAFMRQVCDGLG